MRLAIKSNRMLYHSNALKCNDKQSFPNKDKKGQQATRKRERLSDANDATTAWRHATGQRRGLRSRAQHRAAGERLINATMRQSG